MARAKQPRPAFDVKALTICCTDLSRSERFYTEVLGGVREASESLCPWYRLGSFPITLVPNGSGPNPLKFGEHPLNMLWLEVDDLPAAQRHFERHKVEYLHPGDGQMVIIADPDGLPIEVWQREPEAEEANAAPRTKLPRAYPGKRKP